MYCLTPNAHFFSYTMTRTSYISIRLFRIISIPSKFCYFRLSDHVISMECSALNFRCQCTQQKLQSICAVLTFDHQHKKILTFSVKDRCQLHYFICMKDFNADTITSLKLNLFSLFICGCQHHQGKTICLYVYVSDIKQIVGYWTPVFIQRFPWCLHITITYNLPHLRLWYADVVTVISQTPEVVCRKRRNVVGFDMIRNNRITRWWCTFILEQHASLYLRY
jgi:hypothetical protein